MSVVGQPTVHFPSVDPGKDLGGDTQKDGICSAASSGYESRIDRNVPSYGQRSSSEDDWTSDESFGEKAQADDNAGAQTADPGDDEDGTPNEQIATDVFDRQRRLDDKFLFLPAPKVIQDSRSPMQRLHDYLASKEAKSVDPTPMAQLKQYLRNKISVGFEKAGNYELDPSNNRVDKNDDVNKTSSNFSLNSLTSQESGVTSATTQTLDSADEVFSHTYVLKQKRLDKMRRRSSARSRSSDSETRCCFICNQVGHVARRCPLRASRSACPRCQALVDPNGKEKVRKGSQTYVPETSVFEGVAKGSRFDTFDSIPITLTGQKTSNLCSIKRFEEANLHQKVVDNVLSENYEKATPVQRYAIPIILLGRDLMACAQTGSGKTLAFVLPILSQIFGRGVANIESKSPLALILVPTRELASQVHKHVERFGRGTDIKSMTLYGGTSLAFNVQKIEEGCHIVIATPGRLLALMHRKQINLSNVKYFVLDEADRLLDLGFESDIVNIQKNGMLPKGQRQTMMFSATFPKSVQCLAASFMINHLFLCVGDEGVACHNVRQSVILVPAAEKKRKLIEILNQLTGEKVMVFVEQKRNADFLASYLSLTGFPSTSIHGDREQPQREEALRDFRRKTTPILIATNVAARGLDIPEVEMVVNYDVPSSADEYVHRVGRTGRCGNLGNAITFFDDENTVDVELSPEIVRQLRLCQQDVPKWLELLAEKVKAAESRSSRDSRNSLKRGMRAKGPSEYLVDAAMSSAEDWEDFQQTQEEETWD